MRGNAIGFLELFENTGGTKKVANAQEQAVVN
jgi:hypothetical protein